LWGIGIKNRKKVVIELELYCIAIIRQHH